MTEKDKIIEALQIIQTWYECNSPTARRDLDKIIFELKEKQYVNNIK